MIASLAGIHDRISIGRSSSSMLFVKASMIVLLTSCDSSAIKTRTIKASNQYYMRALESPSAPTCGPDVFSMGRTTDASGDDKIDQSVLF